MRKCVAILATLDTKGAEVDFVPCGTRSDASAATYW